MVQVLPLIWLGWFGVAGFHWKPRPNRVTCALQPRALMARVRTSDTHSRYVPKIRTSAVACRVTCCVTWRVRRHARDHLALPIDSVVNHSHYKDKATMAFFNAFGAVTDPIILNPGHEEFEESKCLDRFKISGVEYVRSSSLATGK